jgi:hypothetical protein
VTQLMNAAVIELRGGEHPTECLPHVGFVERRAGDRRKHPGRKRESLLEPRRTLAPAMEPEHEAELSRKVDPPLLVVRGRGQLTPHDVPLHANIRRSPVDVAPLPRTATNP